MQQVWPPRQVLQMILAAGMMAEHTEQLFRTARPESPKQPGYICCVGVKRTIDRLQLRCRSEHWAKLNIKRTIIRFCGAGLGTGQVIANNYSVY
tara:strand:- start:1030 stop:1311 length:282 start_codon:yes stop_codon:yes gene_type:complete